MSIKKCFKTWRNNYVINQVQKLEIPEFEESTTHRYRILFSGRVQKVGFRLEVSELAKRLHLTGFCENLENGDVLAELQGPQRKINYLITFMELLKRIKIENKVVEEIQVDESEVGFVMR